MSTELVLDFDKIRETEAPLPNIAVADFIPLKGDGRDNVLPVRGIVLELKNSRALRSGIILPTGPGILYVRLPTGETLAERVEVDETGKLTLKVARPEDAFDLPEVIAREYVAPRAPSVVNIERGSSEHADPSRWSTIKVEHVEPRRGRTPPKKLSSFLEPFASRVVSERQGNQGIAKLQSSPGMFSPAHRLDGNTYFESALVGHVQAVKPTKLYGRRDDLRAQWKAKSSHARPHRAEEHDRYFALSFEVADEPVPLQVACLPAKWRTVNEDSARLTIQYVSGPTGTERRRVVVNVDDPRFSALLQFMQTGDLASSVSLLREAENALYEKFMNPYAAAAGGYVLTHAGLPSWNHHWGRWLHNLATRFPALPDGHILLANLILQGPEACKERIPGYERDLAWELALDSVLESVRRGPPMYRFGLRMLSSSIAILSHLVGADHLKRRHLNAAADHVLTMSVRVDRHQPFCVFDVGRNAP